MLKIFKKMFDTEYIELKRFNKIADEIVALDEKMSKLSDKQLQAYTNKFKKRLEEGETLDDLVVEAFAVCREAAYRCVKILPIHSESLVDKNSFTVTTCTPFPVRAFR